MRSQAGLLRRPTGLAVGLALKKQRSHGGVRPKLSGSPAPGDRSGIRRLPVLSLRQSRACRRRSLTQPSQNHGGSGFAAATAGGGIAHAERDEHEQEAADPGDRPPERRPHVADERERARGVRGQRRPGSPSRSPAASRACVETGTKTELAKTSGKITTKPADCAASAPRHRERDEGEDPAEREAEGATTATQPSACQHAPVEAEADRCSRRRSSAR